MNISDLIAQFTRTTTYYLDSVTWKDIPRDVLQKYRRKRLGLFAKVLASKRTHLCPVCGYTQFISAFDRTEEKSDNSFYPGMMVTDALICNRCGALEVIHSRSLIFREGDYLDDDTGEWKKEYVLDERFVGITIEEKTFAQGMKRQAEKNAGIREFILGKK